MSTHAFMLNDDERKSLEHQVDDDLDVLALPVPRGSGPLLRELAAQIHGRALGADEVADLLARVGHLPSASTTAALTRMEQRWRDLAGRYGLLSSAEVAELAGSRARNRAEHASSLTRQGKIVAVRRGGRALFPGFQFTEHGRPVDAVASVLTFLRAAGWADESIVLWFDAPNGYLDEGRPAQLLESDPDAVGRAATHAAARSDW